MLKELHSVKPFRKVSNLGIIRLNNLAQPKSDKITIKIGEKRIAPIGFDTYGHPIISETAYTYYKAQKENAERRGESFIAEVEYEIQAFCIKREVYDSVDSIKEALKDLKKFKQLLVYRKQARFCGMGLNTFLIYNKYVLYSDGKIYYCVPEEEFSEDVVQIKENEALTEQEIHVPDERNVCAICGQPFNMENDIQNFNFDENKKFEKVHKICLESFTKETNHQLASQIVDAVYNERPKTEIVQEGNITWYKYQTNQGKIRIRFKTKVIVIEWYNDFKPFNVLSLFESERVTKYDNEDIRGIHAWSKDDAIQYLSMAKKA